MDSRELIRALKLGWYEVNQIGSHKQFKDPTKKGPRDGPVPEEGHPPRNPEEH
jgi:hypothetical protein